MYARPRTPWQAERIAGEVEVVKAYGLRNKRELWKAQAVLRKYRQVSRKMLAAVSIGQAPPRGRSHSQLVSRGWECSKRKEISTPSFP